VTKQALRSLIALVAGLAIGILISTSASSALHSFAAALEPVGTIWVNAIRMTVIPLVVSLLIATIAEEKDIRAVGRLGGRAVAMYVVILSTLALLTFLAAPPLFALLDIDSSSAATMRSASSAAGVAPALPSFTSWLVGLVPANPVKAAVDGAMLPVILFAVAFAAALARIDPERRAAATALFRGLADAMLVIVGWILALAPIGVFCLAVALAEKVGAGVAGAVAFYLALHSGFLIVATIALYAIVRIFSTVPLAQFARALIPAQLVAITTRSSVAALPAMIDGATRVLHLPQKVSGFALPFGVSVFRLNQAVTWIASALFVSKLYGVPLSTSQLAFLGACSVAMSFSIPGIPSGGLFIIAPFFVSVGLPIEGMGILLALDAIPDVFKTLLNVTSQMATTVLLARGEPTETLEATDTFA
jgi:proton glutamate symport protein